MYSAGNLYEMRLFIQAEMAQLRSGAPPRAELRDLARWRELAWYINSPPPCRASHHRKFKRGGPKENSKTEENKKDKDPRALKTDEIEQEILARNLEEVKNKLSPVIVILDLYLSCDFY